MKKELFPIAILAGGLATRLRPLTQKMPKALLDIDGRPFIAHQLDLLRRAGIGRVVICAGHLGEMIQEYVGDGHAFGLDVRFSFDGPKLLGTAGAVAQAMPLLGEDFFVMYGDSYLLCDYAAVQEAFAVQGKLALMTVFHNEGRFDTSNVEFAGGRIIAYDKRNRTDRMTYIDYGLGMFTAKAFESVPADEPTDLAQLYGRMLRDGQLAACEVTRRFYEIGSLEGLEETRALLRGKLPR